MRPLERQAAAARSHASLAEELRALRLYLVGRELASLDARRRAATSERDRLGEAEATLRTRLERAGRGGGHCRRRVVGPARGRAHWPL